MSKRMKLRRKQKAKVARRVAAAAARRKQFQTAREALLWTYELRLTGQARTRH